MAIEFRRSLSASELAALVNQIAAENGYNRPQDVTARTHHLQRMHASLQENNRLDYQLTPHDKLKVRIIAGRTVLEIPGSSLEQENRYKAIAQQYLGTDVRVRR